VTESRAWTKKGGEHGGGTFDTTAWGEQQNDSKTPKNFILREQQSELKGGVGEAAHPWKNHKKTHRKTLSRRKGENTQGGVALRNKILGGGGVGGGGGAY